MRMKKKRNEIEEKPLQRMEAFATLFGSDETLLRVEREVVDREERESESRVSRCILLKRGRFVHENGQATVNYLILDSTIRPYLMLAHASFLFQH